MYSVLLDDNSYFTGTYAKIGNVANGVKVVCLPPDLTNHKTTCWQLVEGAWVFDEAKHTQLLAEIEAYVPPKTELEITNEYLTQLIIDKL